MLRLYLKPEYVEHSVLELVISTIIMNFHSTSKKRCVLYYIASIPIASIFISSIFSLMFSTFLTSPSFDFELGQTPVVPVAISVEGCLYVARTETPTSTATTMARRTDRHVENGTWPLRQEWTYLELGRNSKPILLLLSLVD